MPRAYIEMILSSKPGKRRWYLAISCGSKSTVPIARNRQLASRSGRSAPSCGRSRCGWLPAPLRPRRQMMVHLGVQHPLGQRLLQLVRATRPESNTVFGSAPASNWSSTASGIRGALRRAMRGLLPSHHAARTRNSRQSRGSPTKRALARRTRLPGAGLCVARGRRRRRTSAPPRPTSSAPSAPALARAPASCCPAATSPP